MTNTPIQCQDSLRFSFILLYFTDHLLVGRYICLAVCVESLKANKCHWLLYETKRRWNKNRKTILENRQSLYLLDMWIWINKRQKELFNIWMKVNDRREIEKRKKRRCTENSLKGNSYMFFFFSFDFSFISVFILLDFKWDFLKIATGWTCTQCKWRQSTAVNSISSNSDVKIKKKIKQIGDCVVQIIYLS